MLEVQADTKIKAAERARSRVHTSWLSVERFYYWRVMWTKRRKCARGQAPSVDGAWCGPARVLYGYNCESAARRRSWLQKLAERLMMASPFASSLASRTTEAFFGTSRAMRLLQATPIRWILSRRSGWPLNQCRLTPHQRRRSLQSLTLRTHWASKKCGVGNRVEQSARPRQTH